MTKNKPSYKRQASGKAPKKSAKSVKAKEKAEDMGKC